MNRHERRKLGRAAPGPRVSPNAQAAGVAFERALARQRAGDLAGAVDGYREVLALDAANVNAHMNLGNAFLGLGVQTESIQHYRRALELEPKHARMHLDFAVALAEFGRWDEAIAEAQRSIALNPHGAEELTTLGKILTDVGRRDEAAIVLRRATTVSPMYAPTYYHLFRAVFDDRDLGPSIDALTKAVVADASFVWARFGLGVVLDLAGQATAARQQFASLHPDPAVFRGAVDSWEYAKAKRGAATRFFVTTRDTLLFALDQAKLDGLVLEFGVRYGVSTRWIAAQTKGEVHGFDSFEGLPTTWHTQPQGAYSTYGARPDVPPNVALHVGLFDETLPAFLRQTAGPLRFVNVDCDLYSSTLAALTPLADRVVPGTVMVFDEYLVNDAWRDDEWKAFQELCGKLGWRYEYLAFNLFTGQAVVRIL